MGNDVMLGMIDQYGMIPAGGTVVVAVSGGADSMYLLSRLYDLRPVRGFNLVVAHFNHQLRGIDGDRDEQFVRDFVQEHCTIQRVKTANGEKFLPIVPIYVDTAPVGAIATERGKGVEETARELRYAFLQRVAEEVGGAVIATGHNADDNGETMVMNLVRGSGLRGLAGIPPVRENIIRPILPTTRQEIVEYLTRRSIAHIEDATNADVKYTRNALRHQVMPLLIAQNPNLLALLGGESAIFRQEDALLEQMAEDALAGLMHTDHGVKIPARTLVELPEPLALRAIQRMATLCAPQLVLERRHRQAIHALARGQHPSTQCSLPHGMVARREYEWLVLEHVVQSGAIAECALNLAGETVVGGYTIRCVACLYGGESATKSSFWVENRGEILLRSRSQGDTIKPLGRRSKTVKRWLVEDKIPKVDRDGLPVLVCEGTIIAVAELGVAHNAHPSVGANAWHITIEKTNKGV